MKTYCVSVLFEGNDNFIVQANSPEEARQLAEQKFKAGDEPDLCGNESQDFVSTGVPEEIQ